ncbi:MAG TPA: glutaredoxin family protein [Acidimicrobiia bacterium]
MKQIVVTFLTRPGCLLCADALPVVEREARRAGHEVVIVDIETDDRLVAEYGLRIPVLLGPDGGLLVEGPIEDVRSLRRALRTIGRGGLRSRRR